MYKVDVDNLKNPFESERKPKKPEELKMVKKADPMDDLFVTKDPFEATDPFANIKTVDPFANTKPIDPFASNARDPFLSERKDNSNDPFNSGRVKEKPKSKVADPFGDPFGKENKDLFGADPFSDPFGSHTRTNDPFAVNKDPFGGHEDPFAGGDVFL